MHHYLYVIYNEETGEYYIGMRSSTLPPHTDPYMGSHSDLALRQQMQAGYPWCKYVVATFETREELKVAEGSMIREHLDNGCCVNRGIGWKLGEESLQRMAKGVANAWQRPEVQERQHQARVAAQNRPEVRARNREAQIERFADPEKHARWLAASTAAQNRPSTKAKHANNARDLHNRPDVVASKSQKMKAYWAKRREDKGFSS